MDARLREMQFLARLDRDGPIKVHPPYDSSPERQMIISLLHEGYVNGIDSAERDYPHPGLAVRAAVDDRTFQVGQLLATRADAGAVEVRICHKGRVRLSELGQQLKTGRDRDGLLWAKRHLLTDLGVSILSASPEAPLSVAFVDMNGLKAINDTYGHHAGDEAINAFFQAIVATVGQSGEAYRNGGDEVVVILPQTDESAAANLLDTFVRQLGKELLPYGTLTASCGSVTTADPNADAQSLLGRADQAQYRAKGVSKQYDPRISAVAAGDHDVAVYSPPGAPAPDAPVSPEPRGK